MNHIALLQALTLAERAVALMKKAIEDDMPRVEPALNKSRLAKATGMSRGTIAHLMRSGAVATFEEGRKARASDIQRAVQDRMVRMMGQSRARQPQAIRRLKVF